MAKESPFPHSPFHHSTDSPTIDISDTLGWEIHLPKVLGFQITKYMVMELLAAVIILAVFLPLARRIRTGEPPRGKLWNAMEFILTFIRNEIAKPSLGKDADKFVPFLWTQFLFILACNLLGMLPFLGTATGSLAVTGVLALIVFIMINAYGIAANGLTGYLKSYVPHVERDTAFLRIMGPFLVVGLSAMEVMSLFIRSIVLAVRLFATMFAGHTVLFVLLLFIQMVGLGTQEGTEHYFDSADLLFWPVSILSWGLAVALSVLELFIAALQAFVFTFLTAVFIGMAMHPQH